MQKIRGNTFVVYLHVSKCDVRDHMTSSLQIKTMCYDWMENRGGFIYSYIYNYSGQQTTWNSDLYKELERVSWDEFWQISLYILHLSMEPLANRNRTFFNISERFL